MFHDVKKKILLLAAVAICLFTGIILRICILEHNQRDDTKIDVQNDLREVNFEDVSQDEMIEDIAFAKNHSFAYVIKDCKLFYYEKTKQGYGNPKEIALPDGQIPITVNISSDDKEIYLSVAGQEEYEKYINGESVDTGYAIKAVKALRTKDNLKDWEEIEDLNTENCRIFDVLEDGSIFYTNSKADVSPIELCLASKTENGYDVSSLEIEELEEYTFWDAAMSRDGNYLIICAEEINKTVASDSDFLTKKLIVLEKKEDSYTNLREVQGLLEENENFNSVLGISDGRILYSCFNYEKEEDEATEEKDAENYTFDITNGEEKSVIINILEVKIKWCTMSTLDLVPVAQDSEEETNQEPYDSAAYLNSQFKEIKREKGDMSKKQGVWYEIFVRSFADSNGDGIGDLKGVTEHLDYLSELGIDGIWLMPVFESGSYHGYDVTDFTKINPDYGTEEDLAELLEEAHKRNIKVILDFPINHTSSEHPWFVEACEDPDSQYAGYYRFVNKEDTDQYNTTDVSPWGSNVWHKIGNSYYYGIFGETMPDLNYNNPELRKEIKSAAEKWINMGVDGYRLDAAMHIYGNHEFYSVENQEEANVQWWNEFAADLEKINPEIYLVGEAWEEDDLLESYVQPFDTTFNFPFRNNLIPALNSESAVLESGENIADFLKKMLDTYDKVDENYLNGVISGNHDLPRILSAAGSEEKAKLAANICLTLPGNPFIYYGEELGMKGAEGSDYNYRTAFLWGEEADTTQIENYENDETASLKEQKQNENSMYHHYKELIALRKAKEGLTGKVFEPVDTENDSVMAYRRGEGKTAVYILHNLSSTPVTISLNEIKNGNVIYNSTVETSMKNGIITLDAYSTIMIDEVVQ